MKKRFQVVLKLSRLSVQEKVTKAKFIVTSMTGNAYFATPNPELAVITSGANDLEAAAALAAGGGIKLTADMRAKEDALQRDLNTLAAYVEATANVNANLVNAVAIITSAGMEVKTTQLKKTGGFRAITTGLTGEVKLLATYVNGTIYHWQQSKDGITWEDIGVSRKASFIRENLISDTRYYFRVAVGANNGLRSWSDAISIRVL